MLPKIKATDSLSAWYRCDGITDSSPNSNNLTYDSAPDIIDGRIGKAFDCYPDRGAFSNSLIPIPSGNDPRTFAMWFKLNNIVTNYSKCLGGWGDNAGAFRRFDFFITGTQIGLELSSSAVLTNWTNDTNWHHIAATFNGSNVSDCILYFDGQKIVFPLVINDGGINTQLGEVRIASLPGAPSGYYCDAVVDEFLIYPRALSSQEVSMLYSNKGLVVKIKPDLWLSADNLLVGAITTWPDNSGNGFDAAGTGTVIPNILNGKSIVRLDSSSNDKFLTSGLNLSNTNASWTVIAVARYNGLGSNATGRVIGGAANDWLLGWYNNTQDAAYLDGGWCPGNPPSLGDTNWKLYTVQRNGYGSSIWSNGLLLGSSQAYYNGPAGIELSGYNNGSEMADCDVAEVLAYSYALNDEARTTIESYLRNKWGV